MDVRNEEINLRLLSWQNILNSGQTGAEREEKLANQGEALRGGINCIYLSLSNKITTG